MTLKDIDFKTSQYLLNMLLNGNKYIIIDETFWKAICEKGKEYSIPIIYEISENRNLLKVKLMDDIPLMFDNIRKDNILEQFILRNISGNNFESIMKTYQNIRSYYNLEIEIKKGAKIIGRGYLIEKDWIDKWKHQIKYENIKSDYLVISNKSIKEIIDKLIYIFEENKYKLIDLKEIKYNELNVKQKIKEYLKNNSLVLVNSDFIESFKQIHFLKEINYILYENTIDINFGSGDPLKFKTIDNIIQPLFGEIENELIKNVDNININNQKINLEINKKNEIPRFKIEDNQKYFNQIDELKK